MLHTCTFFLFKLKLTYVIDVFAGLTDRLTRLQFKWPLHIPQADDGACQTCDHVNPPYDHDHGLILLRVCHMKSAKAKFMEICECMTLDPPFWIMSPFAYSFSSSLELVHQRQKIKRGVSKPEDKSGPTKPEHYEQGCSLVMTALTNSSINSMVAARAHQSTTDGQPKGTSKPNYAPNLGHSRLHRLQHNALVCNIYEKVSSLPLSPILVHVSRNDASLALPRDVELHLHMLLSERVLVDAM
jgi:hypothetical protein